MLLSGISMAPRGEMLVLLRELGVGPKQMIDLVLHLFALASAWHLQYFRCKMCCLVGVVCRGLEIGV